MTIRLTKLLARASVFAHVCTTVTLQLPCGCAGPPAASDSGLDGDAPDAASDGDEAHVCGDCHGTGEDDPTPPPDTEGNRGTSAPGVGAHASHMTSAPSWHRPVECADCHVVPTEIEQPGHHDTERPAEVTFGDHAAHGEVAPSYDGERCANVYCHGVTLPREGEAPAPVWTRVDGTASTCGACHDRPPADPHVQRSDCSTCHTTIDANGDFTDPGSHINGEVDIRDETCTGCHGSGDEPAPPVDTEGNTATWSRGVGAHRAHVGTSDWHARIDCEQCHTLPEDVRDEGHVDSELPAELEWGDLATADRARPSFDGERCSNVYCHGGTLFPGGSNTAPHWASAEGTEVACGTCHSLPPGAPHPLSDQCSACHATIEGSEVIAVPDLHINGSVDFRFEGETCNLCHGSGGEPAPPLDTLGNDSTSARGVGAHRSHLAPSTWRARITCDACHAVPPRPFSVGHVDTPLPAELTWGEVARADGASPAFDGVRCLNLYCHGATLLPGGTSTTPVWTTVDGSQSACGTCHGTPPSAHPAGRNDCESCHGDVIDAEGVFVAPESHVDGRVQATRVHVPGWAEPAGHGARVIDTGLEECRECHGEELDSGFGGITCNSCHPGWAESCTQCHGGTDNATGAPPEGCGGEVLPEDPAVGAHSSHVEDTEIHTARPCSACHVAPLSALSAGHLDGDGRAEVVFGALNSAADYDPETGSCANLYCHGNGHGRLGGVVWTSTEPVDCSSCHPYRGSTADEFRAMSGQHLLHAQSSGFLCSVCHATTVNEAGVITGRSTHVDGGPDVEFDTAAAGAMRRSGGRCFGGCHFHPHVGAAW